MSTRISAWDSVERKVPGFLKFPPLIAILALEFVITIKLIKPVADGDDVGNYAYLRAPLIQHNLRFEEEWRHCNRGFAETRTGPDNQLRADQYGATGRSPAMNL